LKTIQISEEGFPVTLANGKKVVSRGVILTGVMDTPAKADCQYFTHHNGKYGCPFCLNPGEHVDSLSSKNGKVHVYSYDEYPLRSHDETILHASQSYKSDPV